MRFFLTLTLFFVTSLRAYATEYLDQMIKRIQQTISPQISTHQIPGAMIAIYHEGSVRYLSFGQISKNSQIKPNRHTLFQVGSITKTFTGLLLSQKVTEGNLNGNELISDFIPQWKEQRHTKISLKELLTHRSGLPLSPCNYPERQGSYSEENLIHSLTDSVLERYPDCLIKKDQTGKIIYSNWGYSILGHLLARLEFLDYPELLKQKITQPLNLKDTVISLSPEQRQRAATGYNNRLQEINFFNRSILMGQGAISSTAHDLIEYSKAYLEPENTPFPSALKNALVPQYKTSEHKLSYAWFITPDGNYSHLGQTSGFSSLLKIYPGRNLAVVYLVNSSSHLKCFIESVEGNFCDLKYKKGIK